MPCRRPSTPPLAPRTLATAARSPSAWTARARHVIPVVVALVVLVLPRFALAATTCSTDCAQTACTVGCNETDIRDAIKKANDCKDDPAWQERTISVDTTPEAPCTIPMVNDAANAALFPGSSCNGDPDRHSVCFTNDHITFDGSGAVFVYAGTALCGQCASGCALPQPALFTLKGTGNTIRNFTYRHFPEGLQIRAGSLHTIEAVRADRICEDAISINTTAGTGHVIRNSILLGNQDPEPGHTCMLASGASGPCGTDKAIQLNGGGSRIEDNVIDLISQPVGVAGGTHTIASNRSQGSPRNQNICQSYTVSGSASVSFHDNTLDHCKFGVRVEDTALVVAEDNTITNPWLSAFTVRDAGRLKAARNRIKSRAGGFTHVSDCQRGLVVARSDARARIDLGGGDAEGRSVVDGVPCIPGSGCSAGGNRFCSIGVGVQTDIWNITDCPCLNHFCNGALGVCTPGSCAPIDADGACVGTNGQGASIGARDNCFASPDSGASVADVEDAGASTTATAGARACTPAECDF